jgi:hypothetical protein
VAAMRTQGTGGCLGSRGPGSGWWRFWPRRTGCGSTSSPCATLASWSVLLLALRLLHPDDVSGAGPFIGLVAALLAFSAYALRIALPARREL